MSSEFRTEEESKNVFLFSDVASIDLQSPVILKLFFICPRASKTEQMIKDNGNTERSREPIL